MNIISITHRYKLSETQRKKLRLNNDISSYLMNKNHSVISVGVHIDFLSELHIEVNCLNIDGIDVHILKYFNNQEEGIDDKYIPWMQVAYENGEL